MAKLPILDFDGKQKESIDVPEEILGGPVNQDIIHQAVVMYHANKRQGQASTKERGAVSGGGKKPWRQKGTGRARAGSSRSPLWTGGGVVFGPHPRDYSYSIPKKIKIAALKETINAKYHDKDLLCLDDVKKPLSKTKEFAQILKNLKLEGKILAIMDGSDSSVARVTRNIPFFNMIRVQDVNAFDVLKNKKLLVTKSAIKALIDRIK
jgi:large subunit ribosomal protein L4